MAALDVIAAETHKDKFWLPPNNILFAARDIVVPLAIQEVSQAVMAFPIAFVKVGERFHLVGVMGFFEDQNLFVSPDGRWLTHYIPAQYRSYPFGLGTTDEDTRVLCFRKDSGLLLNGAEGQDTAMKFFDDDGNLSPKVNEVLKILTGLEHSSTLFNNTAEVLNKHRLIQPWRLEIPTSSGSQKVKGLYKIDETALNALSAETFPELREHSALIVIYCQLLSTQHISDMILLRKQHEELMEKDTTGGVKLNPDMESGTLNFENL